MKNEICNQNLANYFMISKPKSISQLGFYSTFEEQLNRSHPLHILANQINWNLFEEALQNFIQKKNDLENQSG